MPLNNKKRKPFYKRKKIVIPIVILIVLIAFRFYLPTWVKNHINKVLAEIPGYYGQVSDVEISLYRGAYVVNGMYLNKVKTKTEVPFIKFPKTDISVEWKSLLKGSIVAEVIMHNPKIIYINEDQELGNDNNLADVSDWTEALQDIVPLEINNFQVNNGEFAFVLLEADPNIDLQLNQISLKASNLRNVIEKERILPSPINATAVSFGGGNVKLNGNLNLFKEIPDLDISMSLENAQANALNDLTSYYSGLDFETGKFELFGEIAIADGYMKGYLKPLLTNTTMIGEEDGFLETIWEGLTSFFKFILKNHGNDTIATEVPLEGDLNNLKAGIWPTIGGIFKNGWFKAFASKPDDKIEFKDAFKESNHDKSVKKKRRD